LTTAEDILAQNATKWDVTKFFSVNGGTNCLNKGQAQAIWLGNKGRNIEVRDLHVSGAETRIGNHQDGMSDQDSELFRSLLQEHLRGPSGAGSASAATALLPTATDAGHYDTFHAPGKR